MRQSKRGDRNDEKRGKAGMSRRKANAFWLPGLKNASASAVSFPPIVTYHSRHRRWLLSLIVSPDFREEEDR